MAMSNVVPIPVDGRKVLRIAVEDLAAHIETLEADLQGVSAIELTRGETVVAEVRAPVAAVSRSAKLPDFMAQLRATWGDQPLNVDTTEWIREEREERF